MPMFSLVAVLAFHVQPLSRGVELGQQLRSPIVQFDFEGSSYGDWRVEGTAFGAGPAQGTLPNQMTVSGFLGLGLVNSFFGGDGSTGRLISPGFKIQRKYLSFFIGGGLDSEKLTVQLLIGGRAVRVATGLNSKPGGSEELARMFWDVSEYEGKLARIEIVDMATGGWGHINVDHFVQTDIPPKGQVKEMQKSFVANKQFLHIPIKNGAAKRVVTLVVDGKVEVRNNIELADGPPDWWAPMDISRWKGKKLIVRVDRIPEDSEALNLMELGDSVKGSNNLYREQLRGQFHFSPMRGWNNDPNGLVYFNGEYHMFFQHNPYGWSWENMHWGHAVSKDMVHWREFKDALLPDSSGTMFSGSAVVDWKNSSGFGTAEKPPMVLFYTSAGETFTQGLAFSHDGRTFEKFQSNPAVGQITHGNRDPKVFWHEPTQKWVMVLYVERAGTHTIEFLSSKNMKDWVSMSRIDGFYECPDFFELAVDGNPKIKKWILTAASSEYQVGTFDGTAFRAETPKLPGHRGAGFYAAQTFSDLPDGRRVQIGWFQTETKGMTFNQSMTIPLELKLVSTSEGPRLSFSPVKELQSLRGKEHRMKKFTVVAESEVKLTDCRAELLEMDVDFEPFAQEVRFLIRGAEVIYDSSRQELVVNGKRASAPLIEGRQHLKIFCDRTGLEIFASGGLCYVPMPFQPKAEDRKLSATVSGGPVTFHSVSVHELKSAWD